MLTNLSLFSGVGGLDLAAKWTSKIRTVAYVECDPYAQGVLMSRMRDGSLDDAPIFEDVRTFDGRSLRGYIDIVSGGFPCQPHSGINAKTRKGPTDERNLWPEYLRIVRECKPTFILGENVEGIITNGFAFTVLADLEEAGYCAIPATNTSCASNGPCVRKRVFFIAHTKSLRPHANEIQERNCRKDFESRRYGRLESTICLDLGRFGRYFVAEHLRVGNGMAQELDEIGRRIKACGNGVDPYMAILAWEKIIAMSEAGQ